MPGQWEQRQFLARCPNNSAPRLHIYLPVWRNEKKKGGGKERNTDWNRRVSVFIHAWRTGMCSCAWFASLNKPAPPPYLSAQPPLHVFPSCFPFSSSSENICLKSSGWEGRRDAGRNSGCCRPSVWIAACVWEGSKCTGSDMLFVDERASPLTPFFFLMGSAWVSIGGCFFFFP